MLKSNGIIQMCRTLKTKKLFATCFDSQNFM